MPAMELAQRLVIGRGSARQKAKAQVFPHPLFQFARGAHIQRESIQPHLHHQPRMVGTLSPGVGIRVDKFLQIPTFHYIVQQKT